MIRTDLLLSNSKYSKLWKCVQEQSAQQIVTDATTDIEAQGIISESVTEQQAPPLSKNSPRYNQSEVNAIVDYLTKDGLFDPEYILLQAVHHTARRNVTICSLSCGISLHIISCRQNAICVTNCLSDDRKSLIRICMSARGSTSNRIIPCFSITPISRVCCFTARIASIFDDRKALQFRSGLLRCKILFRHVQAGARFVNESCAGGIAQISE